MNINQRAKEAQYAACLRFASFAESFAAKRNKTMKIEKSHTWKRACCFRLSLGRERGFSNCSGVSSERRIIVGQRHRRSDDTPLQHERTGFRFWNVGLLRSAALALGT